MTLNKLITVLDIINGCGDINLLGSHMWATGGGELSILFNTQPPKSLHDFLKQRGFIEWQGEYIYRPRKS